MNHDVVAFDAAIGDLYRKICDGQRMPHEVLQNQRWVQIIGRIEELVDDTRELVDIQMAAGLI